MKNQSLKERYEKLVEIYIDQFCKKHEVELEFWIGDQVGETACIASYFLQFEDIRHDIDNGISKSKIWDWLGNAGESDEHRMNYRNYLNGNS